MHSHAADGGQILDIGVLLQRHSQSGRPAIRSSDGLISYRDLSLRVERLARQIAQRTSNRDAPVASLFPRSPAAIISMLAVFSAGRTYLPLAIDWPQHRIVDILHRSGASILVAPPHIGRGLERSVDDVIAFDISSDCKDDSNLTPGPVLSGQSRSGYVVFTSGSTGTPKGVLVGEGALRNYARAAIDAYGLDPTDTVLQLASLAFDASLEEVIPTIAVGGSIAAPGTSLAPDVIFDRVREFGVTVLNLPTAYWHAVCADLDSRTVPDTLRLVIVGGESMTYTSLKTWQAFAPGVRVMNTYGPTEATVVASVCDVTNQIEDESGDGVPIGRALGNAALYVLDEQLREVGPGREGELFIGGPTLADGYLGDTALTAKKFVPDFLGPPGSRMYRTGDVVKRASTGDLVFVGRRDRQVKVDSYRVEPEEVERAILAHPDVTESRVEPYLATGHLQLVAFVKMAVGKDFADEVIRAFVRGRLPEYMVPKRWHVVREFPRGGTGKVDVQALFAAFDAHPESRPLTIEQQLLAIWEDVLGDAAALDDDFFASGGDSLGAARIVLRARRTLGWQITVADIMRARTPRALVANFGAESRSSQ